MLIPHPLDLPAILLGIFLLFRRSDVRGEDPSAYPRVLGADFERWRKAMLTAYSLGARACFGRVFLDFALVALLRRFPLELSLQRTVGLSIDIGWVALLITCWVLVRRARKLGERLGIRPGAVEDSLVE